MRRRVARGIFVLLCGLIATVLGVVSAILWTPPGLRLVARVINEQAQAMVRGSIHVGSVRGQWIEGFSLDSVVIRDSSGVLLAEMAGNRLLARTMREAEPLTALAIVHY